VVQYIIYLQNKEELAENKTNIIGPNTKLHPTGLRGPVQSI